GRSSSRAARTGERTAVGPDCPDEARELPHVTRCSPGLPGPGCRRLAEPKSGPASALRECDAQGFAPDGSPASFAERSNREFAPAIDRGTAGARSGSHSALVPGPAKLLQALLQILLVFLPQLGVARRAVDVARLVPALVELLLRPLVVDVRLVGAVEDLLD